MPNHRLFTHNPANPPVADTTNAAGGWAYSLTNEMALAQYAVTGVFNDTCYSIAKTDLDRVKALCDKCSTEWIARVAIYARSNGLMKDVPAYLVAYLSTRDEKELFYTAFSYVINNIGMLRSFVQIMRNGAVGRKSLGTAPKKAAQRMLAGMEASRIFWQCAGQSPSIQDVLKLVHPQPQNAEQDALFGYLLGRKYEFEALPESVRDLEAFKDDNTSAVPAVDFRRLSTLNLDTEQWKAVAHNMTWNQLRLNLNMLQRKGVFDDPEVVALVAAKLRNPEQVQRARCLPFALYSTTQNITSDVPLAINNAMIDAMEISVQNAPALAGKTLILVDSSASMGQAATGQRTGSTSTMTCSQVAGYFVAALVKANPDDVTVQCFDTQIRPTSVNPRDSAATIANGLSRAGGGTDISCGLQWAQNQRTKFDNIIIISDNESWADRYRFYHRAKGITGIGTAATFANYRQTKNRNAKLILWDIQPHSTTQAAGENTLHVGGFSDSVFKVIAAFTSNRDSDAWKNTILSATNLN